MHCDCSYKMRWVRAYDTTYVVFSETKKGKGKQEKAIKMGKLPFKQELIRPCPQGKEFP